MGLPKLGPNRELAESNRHDDFVKGLSEGWSESTGGFFRIKNFAYLAPLGPYLELAE